MKNKEPTLDDSAITADDAYSKAKEIMDNFISAAANLDAQIDALRKAGFFEHEGTEPILLATKGYEQLHLDGNGKLSYSPEEKESELAKLTGSFGDKTGYPESISSIKAVKKFDGKECIRNIHNALNKLVIFSRQQKEATAQGIKTVVMRPDPPKSLPPKRKSGPTS